MNKEYISRLIEQADILKTLLEIDKDISQPLESQCNYLIGYIHALKNDKPLIPGVGRENMHLCSVEDMHPYNCDTAFGGTCVHCERKKTENHDPATCALCDPEYDFKENKFEKPKGDI